MEKQIITTYFHFGLCHWYLRRAEAGFRIHTPPNSELSFVLNSIDAFRDYLDKLNLQVTQRASTKLIAFREEIANAGEDDRLDQQQATRLRIIMEEIEHTLLAELMGYEVNVVTPKRIDITKLQNQVYTLFAPNVFDKLPSVARYDLNEAGKCIAFDRATAAAFHLMRATESVLRESYCIHVKRNRVKTLLWGPMVTGLQSRTKFHGEEKYHVLFNNLDNLRLSFRNPTQHPEKVYDIEEVQDLWGLCVDVINRMADDIPSIGEKTSNAP